MPDNIQLPVNPSARRRSELLTALIAAGREQGSQEFEELIERTTKERGIELNGHSQRNKD